MTPRPAVVVGATWDDYLTFVEGDEPGGHVTAVAWVFDPVSRSVLLVEHRTLGWSCPGGHLEPGETALDAAVRELAEETGLHLAPVDSEPFALTRTGVCSRSATRGDDHWSLGYRFHGSIEDRLDAEPGQPAGWFPASDLPFPRSADIDAVVAHLARTDRR